MALYELLRESILLNQAKRKGVKTQVRRAPARFHRRFFGDHMFFGKILEVP
jgi:hypothetical protein